MTGSLDKNSAERLIATAVADGGLPTDDVLTAVAPLIRQMMQTHASGFVAPLEGIESLRLNAGQLFYGLSEQSPLRQEVSAIRDCLLRDTTKLEVVSEQIDASNPETDTRVAKSDGEVLRPVYTNGYQSWEHLLGHHDPMTDVFCLGQLLASLACGLDFRIVEDVQRFADHRSNLFSLSSKLHPVLAQAIYQTTHLHREQRPQDLETLLSTLENYREASASIDFDPDVVGPGQTSASKSELILRGLRKRLFDTTRRNRLLHFSPTMATINLTQASVPLSLDPARIDLKKLLLADDDLVERLGNGKSISLTQYIDVQEVLYAPNVLDRIITDDRRDRAEFGFGGLRLAMAFLNWSNAKAQPAEDFNSPLVLVSVTLKKKKGVRDRYYLESLEDEAEVNPILRHQMQQLYAIELPEKIPLRSGAIKELAESLRQQIAKSDTSIQLDVVERPQIDLIRSKAEKRLQLYKKRAKVSGRGVRHFGDLQYSYDPANYFPLGIRIFDQMVRQPETELEAITRSHVAPRRHRMVADRSEQANEKTFYRWKEGGTGNPYHWQVDLCNITLASFKYRRMSLVRDYDSLLAGNIDNAPFEALFSSQPVGESPVTEPAQPATRGDRVTQRFDVVPCDPTQAFTIAQARQGSNYIVQGPPGTGKSQTITNLIADFVARGKRVLFVCEKRAAIDVVYARLKSIGLAPAASLIHDAQADKKEFIADLKETYESFLNRESETGKDGRVDLAKQIDDELASLESVNALQNEIRDSAGMSLAALLDRCLELRPYLPELTALEAERLPRYTDWIKNEKHLEAVNDKFLSLGCKGSLAEQTLAILRPELAGDSQPLATTQSHVAAAMRSLSAIKRRFDEFGLPEEAWQSVSHVLDAARYCEEAAPLAAADLMQAIEVGNKVTPKLNKRVRKLQQLRDHAMQAAAKNHHWGEKLSPEDTDAALDVVSALENRVSRFLKPSWWRLRGVLNRSYNVQAHAVKPKWSSVLQSLKTEQEKHAIAERETLSLQAKYPIAEDPLLWPNRINRVMRAFTENPSLRRTVHRPLMRSGSPSDAMQRIAETKSMAESLTKSLEALTDCGDDLTLTEWLAKLGEIESALPQLPRFLSVMDSLSAMPQKLSWALRRLPLSFEQLESAVANRTYRQELSRKPVAESYCGGTRTAHSSRLAKLYAKWQATNSEFILRSVADGFLDNIACSEDPTPTTREDRNARRSYKKGRRELEHEFGKQMRFKPIRALLSSDCRRIITDLKPIWLMSPLSVSDTLPLATAGDQVADVVIFDEASQVTLEDAVPSLCRGKQVVVVGDQMQLPPTNFFTKRSSSDEEEDGFTYRDDQGDEINYDLSSGSFLEFADRNLASTMLGWHYRSRSESLISFSNWRFYDAQLLTVPEENLPNESSGCVPVASLEDVGSASEMLYDRPISFHHLDHGCYENRRNRSEADHIARLVRQLLCDSGQYDSSDRQLPANPTVGVIAFSQAQQTEIDSAIARLAEDDPIFASRLDEESVREQDGQFVGLLVKNLENIQGDERDVVLLSVCYGPDPEGRVRMNFGPINRGGGEKRLNVAFSRAKHHMAIVTSIGHNVITNDYNTGAAALRDYLNYAEAHCGGRQEEATALLQRLAKMRRVDPKPSLVSGVLKQQLIAALESANWQVASDVGQSQFRIDVAIKKPGDTKYRLGILLDDAPYRFADVFERDVQRPQLLEAFGWKITFVLAKDWYDNPAEELQRVLSLTQS